ncbi:hypothetical protein ABFW14_16805, partial [Mycolicibacterium fortuitum]
MGMGKPSGDYVDQLTEPGGWTEADEDQLYGVASQATQALQQLTFGAFDPWQRERSETFEGGNWSGDAAGAANGKAEAHSEEFATQQNNLVSVVTWNNHVAGLVERAKSRITDNVVEAQKKIEEYKAFSAFGPVGAVIQLLAIAHIISTYHGRNVSEIATTSSEIPTADTWKSPPNALEQLLNQQQLPAAPSSAPDTPLAPAPQNPPIAPEEPSRPLIQTVSNLRGGDPQQAAPNAQEPEVTDVDADSPAAEPRADNPEQAAPQMQVPEKAPDIGAGPPPAEPRAEDPQQAAPINQTPTPQTGPIQQGTIQPPAGQPPRTAAPSAPTTLSTTSRTTATPSAGAPPGTPASTAPPSAAPPAPPPVHPARAGPPPQPAPPQPPVAPPIPPPPARPPPRQPP